MARPGEGKDKWGGWTIDVNQSWWGHKAIKRSWFYIVGCDPKNIPTLPIVLGDTAYVVKTSKKLRDGNTKKYISKRERDATPIDLARWLVELALKTEKEKT